MNYILIIKYCQYICKLKCNFWLSYSEIEEFFNFLSLISAFKDVVIGEQSLTIEEDFIEEDHNQNNLQEDIPILDNNIYQMNEDAKDDDFKSNDDELNPEEWDPW